MICASVRACVCVCVYRDMKPKTSEKYSTLHYESVYLNHNFNKPVYFKWPVHSDCLICTVLSYLISISFSLSLGRKKTTRSKKKCSVVSMNLSSVCYSLVFLLLIQLIYMSFHLLRVQIQAAY